MSDVAKTGDQESTGENVELQLPPRPTDETFEQGTSITIETPSQYKLAIIVRDAVVTFLGLPAAEQTGDKMLELTVASAAAHGYPDVEARLDHMPTQADVDELNAYIAEVEKQMAAQQPDAE